MLLMDEVKPAPFCVSSIGGSPVRPGVLIWAACYWLFPSTVPKFCHPVPNIQTLPMIAQRSLMAECLSLQIYTTNHSKGASDYTTFLRGNEANSHNSCMPQLTLALYVIITPQCLKRPNNLPDTSNLQFTVPAIIPV